MESIGPKTSDNMKAMIKQTGYVTSQASAMSRLSPQRTAESRLVAPTPITLLVAVCVVLTGKPIADASSITVAPAV